MDLLKTLANLGTKPGDDPKLRQNKGILTITAVCKAAACPMWTIAYGLVGDRRSAVVPLAYIALTALSVFLFWRDKRFSPFLRRQAVAIMALPLLLHLSLGGFTASSGVLLWALLGPLIPLICEEPRKSFPWFVTYTLLVVGAGVAEGTLSQHVTPAPAALRDALSVMNIVAVSAIVYGAVRYFVCKLELEQQRIAKVVDSSSEVLDDIALWAKSVGGQIAEAIGADEVGVWIAQGDGLANVTGGDRPAPSEADLRVAVRAKAGEPTGRIVPVLGPAGELLGALSFEGDGVQWHDTAKRLVGSFARHLGSALDLRRMREKLSEASQQIRVTRQDMLDRGIDLLHLCPTCGRCYDQSTARCEDGTELRSPQLLPYRITGRYRLVKMVGEGGMGMVFKAHDERLQRAVAVKVIRGGALHDPKNRLRFEQEARAVARINHPGVIEVFDSGDLEGDSMFIVMEWLEGHDLSELLQRRGPGTPHQVARLLREAGSALGAAHAAGLVHRDIKPANLFLIPEAGSFRVKVLDFGIAKEISNSVKLTNTGALMGTPLYMSPEQIVGESLDARSDLYSLAAVIYEALTGHRVASGEDFIDVLFQVAKHHPPRPSTRIPALPTGVDQAFERALAKSPNARPESVSEWVDELAQVLEAMPEASGGWLGADAQAAEPGSKAARSGERIRQAS